MPFRRRLAQFNRLGSDLKADPRDWMHCYFAAFLYVANWDIHRIALRWPIGALNPDAATAYRIGNFATA